MDEDLASRELENLGRYHGDSDTCPTLYQHTKSEEIALYVTNVEFKSDIFVGLAYQGKDTVVPWPIQHYLYYFQKC
jgi:hypothetical protein